MSLFCALLLTTAALPATFAGEIARAMPGPAISDDLGVRWWKWVNAIPVPRSPLYDDTGANCNVNQDDDLWYLAGTFKNNAQGGVLIGKATRSCNVPTSALIAFPIVNSIDIDTPGVCGQGASIPVADLRTAVAASIDSFTGFGAVLDGKPVTNVRRLVSPVFTLNVPNDNIWSPGCIAAGLGGVPPGAYRPTVDDGYYAVIAPLSRGGHVLRIFANSPGFVLDVTYYLNATDH